MGENYKVVNIYMPTANKEVQQLEVLEELTPFISKDDGAHTFWGETLMSHLILVWISKAMLKARFLTSGSGKN